ncbi:PEGA domain-containing protein [Candidatus Saccharibacteria bacterium]|nr:PEGA domain-containing protein [Candidatus Saccharibacteria bacterium]
MYKQPPKRQQLVKRIFVYMCMVAAVIAAVTFITFFIMGYRLDINNGNVQQYAFLQFNSTPSGAMVSVDGKVTNSNTPNKTSVPAGKHDIVIWRDGYDTWKKSVDVKAGTLTWLNYALLVPKKLNLESVANYKSVFTSLASNKGNYMLVQQYGDKPNFDLINLESDKVKSTSLTIPANVYKDATTAGVTHGFNAFKWDDGGRYVLVSHSYGANSEWLVMDTQSISSTKNITQTLDISVRQINFSDTSGNNFFALDANGDLRKLDLSAGTISKPLVGGVDSFRLYSETKVVTYVGHDSDKKRVVGVYRDGDDKASVLRTFASASYVPVDITATRYFNDNYVAISEGQQVSILSGSYPGTTSDNSRAMKQIESFKVDNGITGLEFSPDGEYVLVKSGSNFTSYDLEYQKVAKSSIEGSSDQVSIKWLNDTYLWSDRSDQLTIREFDGANVHSINAVLPGQAVTITNNGRYLYSIGKSTTGFQLQRVRLILP